MTRRRHALSSPAYRIVKRPACAKAAWKSQIERLLEHFPSHVDTWRDQCPEQLTVDEQRDYHPLSTCSFAKLVVQWYDPSTSSSMSYLLLLEIYRRLQNQLRWVRHFFTLLLDPDAEPMNESWITTTYESCLQQIALEWSVYQLRLQMLL